MAWTYLNDAQCEALFASELQRSDAPTLEWVAEVIKRTLSRLGVDGCACHVAQEFGDHPETATNRMRWVRQLVSDLCVRDDAARRGSTR